VSIEELKRENEILKDALCMEQDRLSHARHHIQNAQDRIKRLEREIELFREHVDYGDVCLVEAILKGEEIGRKEKEAKP
jgi:hypothetical protein